MSVLPRVMRVVENDDPSRRTEVGDLRTDLARSLSVAEAGGPSAGQHHHRDREQLVRTEVLVEHEEAGQRCDRRERLRKRKREWECDAAGFGAPMLCLCTLGRSA